MTQSYLDWEVFERTAPPVSDALGIVNQCLAGAKTFQASLRGLTSDARLYAFHLIKSNFQDARVDEKADVLHVLSGVLTSFQVACMSARETLKDSAQASFTEGDAWKHWIRQLAQILREAGLPQTVRKDTDKIHSDHQQSPFVHLVWELQCSLPEEARRSMWSRPALADAISKARLNRGRKASQ